MKGWKLWAALALACGIGAVTGWWISREVCITAGAEAIDAHNMDCP